MKCIGVIPARFASQRFPGKPLAEIAGKPMLQWVVEGVQKSQRLSEVIVATDDGRIFEAAQSWGVKVAMTAAELPSGSDRVYAAVLNQDADVVVNIQGDEPLIDGRLIDQLIEPFDTQPNLEMATLATDLGSSDLDNKNVVKLIKNCRSEALYFSRFGIPYSRVDAEHPPQACWKHIGLYAYNKQFLAEFCRQPPVALETCESLEQLRALYMGATIHVVNVDCELHGVDTPEDVKKVEELLIKKGNHGS